MRIDSDIVSHDGGGKNKGEVVDHGESALENLAEVARALTPEKQRAAEAGYGKLVGLADNSHAAAARVDRLELANAFWTVPKDLLDATLHGIAFGLQNLANKRGRS